MENFTFTSIDNDQLIQKIAERTVELLKKNGLSQIGTIERQNEIINKKAALKVLGVCQATLWRWEKEGRIKGYGIGAKRFYKRSELHEAMTSI